VFKALPYHPTSELEQIQVIYLLLEKVRKLKVRGLSSYLCPPLSNTFPFVNTDAVCATRVLIILPVKDHTRKETFECIQLEKKAYHRSLKMIFPCEAIFQTPEKEKTFDTMALNVSGALRRDLTFCA
jgi:hypothetical protein